MRYILTLLLAFNVFPTLAQISISTNDMPTTGQIFLTATAPITAITTQQLNNTGANKTWDFNLSVQSTKMDTMIPINQTPITYQFMFFGNDYAQKLSQGINFGTQFSLQNIYNFYKNSNNKFELSGFGGELNGFAVPVNYSPKDLIYQFPLNYNDTYTSNSSFSLPIPSLGAWSEQRSRSNTVDGWGKLILPIGSFDVLRVHSVINDVDSFYVDALSNGIKIPRKSHEYKWLGKGSGIPLLQVNASEAFSIQAVTQITFRTAPSAVEPSKALISALHIYPMPVSDVLNINLENYNSEQMNIEIYNAFGQMIYTKSYFHPNVIQVPVSSLPTGVYYLTMHTGTEAFAQSIQITH